MKAGHIFTIEPMINQGSWKDKLWPDNWTSTTLDGKRSAQFEETLLVTENGVEVRLFFSSICNVLLTMYSLLGFDW